ncbi:MAG: polysaccharide deacetylase family protein [Candidatus Methanofastidiosia archaeon]|jgi:peptidoglycan/xylan/chitin deacetylase (PgdA/CDA1 family)
MCRDIKLQRAGATERQYTNPDGQLVSFTDSIHEKLNKFSSKWVGKIPYYLRILKRIQKGYLVVMYHSVSDTVEDYLYNVTQDAFTAQIAYFAENFHVVNIEDMIENLRNNIQPSQLKVVITFDDGYINNYEIAYPILKKYLTPATFFIATDFIDGKKVKNLGGAKDIPPMNWDHIKEMSSHELVTIGSHTCSHVLLPSLPDNEIEKEVEESKTIIEQHITQSVDTISYPKGLFDLRTMKAVKEAGYTGGFCSEWMVNTSKRNMYWFGRIAIRKHPFNL